MWEDVAHMLDKTCVRSELTDPSFGRPAVSKRLPFDNMGRANLQAVAMLFFFSCYV